MPAEKTPEEEIQAELQRMKNQIVARKRKRNGGNTTVVDSDVSDTEQLLNDEGGEQLHNDEGAEELLNDEGGEDDADNCNDEELLELILQKRDYRIM